MRGARTRGLEPVEGTRHGVGGRSGDLGERERCRVRRRSCDLAGDDDAACAPARRGKCVADNFAGERGFIEPPFARHQDVGINEFIGQRYFDTQIEARTLPYAIWVLRVGGVAFYELGGASDSLKDIVLHQDAGLGLRMLIPQTSAQLLAFDVAVPFDGVNRGTLHFLASVGSQF